MSQLTERFRQVSEGFGARIEATPVDAWSAPSPCAGWTARDVVEHVVGGLQTVMSTVTGGTPEPITEQTDLAGAWRELEQDVLDALADPETAARAIHGPLGEMAFADIVARLGITELLVHSWDLARAVGGDERLDPELVRTAYEAAKPLDSMIRNPQAFGPKVEPPAGADIQTEFLCFLGRTV